LPKQVVSRILIHLRANFNFSYQANDRQMNRDEISYKEAGQFEEARCEKFIMLF
jgi:hypothetical protein